MYHVQFSGSGWIFILLEVFKNPQWLKMSFAMLTLIELPFQWSPTYLFLSFRSLLLPKSRSFRVPRARCQSEFGVRGNTKWSHYPVTVLYLNSVAEPVAGRSHVPTTNAVSRATKSSVLLITKWVHYESQSGFWHYSSVSCSKSLFHQGMSWGARRTSGLLIKIVHLCRSAETWASDDIDPIEPEIALKH